MMPRSFVSARFRKRVSIAAWISTLAVMGNWRPAVAIWPAGTPKCLSTVLRRPEFPKPPLPTEKANPIQPIIDFGKAESKRGPCQGVTVRVTGGLGIPSTVRTTGCGPAVKLAGT